MSLETLIGRVKMAVNDDSEWDKVSEQLLVRRKKPIRQSYHLVKCTIREFTFVMLVFS